MILKRACMRAIITDFADMGYVSGGKAMKASAGCAHCSKPFLLNTVSIFAQYTEQNSRAKRQHPRPTYSVAAMRVQRAMPQVRVAALRRVKAWGCSCVRVG